MRTVLVIDDEAPIRRLCRMVLEGAGYAVETAATGTEGLQLLREHAPDLVVCDIFMPEMNGIETISALAKEAPRVKIIAISGGAAPLPDFLPLTKHLGAVATLAKPFASDELLDAVRSVLGDET